MAELHVRDTGIPDTLSRSERASSSLVSLEDLQTDIDLRYFPTLDEMYRAEGIDDDSLFESVKSKAEASVQKTNRLSDADDELQFLFNCFHALGEKEELPDALQSVADGLSSYQNYLQTFLDGGSSIRQQSQYIIYITKVFNLANQNDLIRLTGNTSKFSRKPTVLKTRDEASNKNWRVLPNVRGEGGYDIAITDDVYEEILEINERGTLIYPKLDHATTSAALPGIARHKALLSRAELARRGETAVSGERSDIDPKVYVARGLNHGKQYSNVSWWDEFPVDIELSEDAQTLRDFAPDYGISLGDEVPIDYIKRLYCPFRYKPVVAAWIDQNIPGRDIVSYEAYYGRDWIR